MKCTQHCRVVAIALGLLALMPAGATPLPAEKDHVISLNGKWRFKLEQPSDAKPHDTGKHPIIMPSSREPFQTLDYTEDSSWKDIKVPSNWEMLGYSPATYGQPDNAIGLYRLEFNVPANWKGRHVGIDFDGVQNGAEVYLNGQPVNVQEPSWGRKNYHEGGFNPFQVDLTPAVKFGEKNLLAVRVTKNTKSADMDSGDFFFLGGIYRNVQLFSIPTNFVSDLTVRTTLLPEDKAEVRVILGIDGKAKATATLEGVPSVDADTSNTAVIVVDHPKLWSAEKPNLYELSIDLKDDAGNVIEHLSKRIGIRQVTIKDGVMMVNNEPVKFTGVCRHEDWATLGAALGPDEWRKDITMMKAANINAIRTSHYPYAAGFYDLCDELGMYVADEMAACWVPTDTDELTPAFGQHAREYVQRDKNHPCVVIWAIGNENKKGKNYQVSADEIRKIDPTRPRLVSWLDGSEYGVELDDRHYTRPAEIAAAEAKPRAAKYPHIYLENPNMWEVRNGADYGCDDLWGAVIDRCWKEIFKDKHAPGTFLWEWADRGVADQCTTKLYDVFPETGIQLLKIKGLVDAFRGPRAALYSVKMACSPVQMDPKPQVSGDTVTLRARNYYSFTNLSELTTTWHLLDDGQEKAKGDVHPDLAPMSEGSIRVNLPAEALATADVLRLDFDWSDGRNVITYDFRLKPEHDKTPAHSSDLTGINFPHLNFTTVDFANGPNGWRQAFRHPGKLMNVVMFTSKGRQKVDDTALYATPLADVRAIDADIQMDVVPATPSAGNKKPSKAAQREAVSEAESQNVGHVHVELNNGKFAYLVNWKNPKTVEVQELGWTFMMPKSRDHFSWHRQAYWSYYPPDQVGRAEGTATPDSADQQLTKLSRVDAFDFNSTKFHCDWASLADKDGQGIVIVCTPQYRQQCRGGIEQDGYDLVVNQQCSPPNDISSGDVPDYMLHLSPGGSAQGLFTVAAMQK